MPFYYHVIIPDHLRRLRAGTELIEHVESQVDLAVEPELEKDPDSVRPKPRKRYVAKRTFERFRERAATEESDESEYVEVYKGDLQEAFRSWCFEFDHQENDLRLSTANYHHDFWRGPARGLPQRIRVRAAWRRDARLCIGARWHGCIPGPADAPATGRGEDVRMNVLPVQALIDALRAGAPERLSYAFIRMNGDLDLGCWAGDAAGCAAYAAALADQAAGLAVGLDVKSTLYG